MSMAALSKHYPNPKFLTTSLAFRGGCGNWGKSPESIADKATFIKPHAAQTCPQRKGDRPLYSLNCGKICNECNMAATWIMNAWTWVKKDSNSPLQGNFKPLLWTPRIVQYPPSEGPMCNHGLAWPSDSLGICKSNETTLQTTSQTWCLPNSLLDTCCVLFWNDRPLSAFIVKTFM